MTDADEMACQQLVEVLTDYLEGVLPERDRDRLERHLEMCEDCQVYLEQMRQMIALTGRLNRHSLQPAARDALLRVFHDWRRDLGSARAEGAG